MIVPDGPYKRVDGKVTGRDSSLPGDEQDQEQDRAYGDGLKEALERKSRKDGCGQILLVYCRTYGDVMDAVRFRMLVARARNSCPPNNFSQAWFVDRAEGFFVEV